MKKIIVVLFLSIFTSNCFADGHVKRILSTSETGMGNEIVYPSGKAKITAFEFTVPVGAPVKPHTHSFPVLIMIQQGEIELTRMLKKLKDLVLRLFLQVYQKKTLQNLL